MMIEAPASPESVKETGIDPEILYGLVAKSLHLHGIMTPSAISRETKLAPLVVNEIITELQRLQYIEAKSLLGGDMRSEQRYALGGEGRIFVDTALALSQYVGPAPVSLESWIKQIGLQSISRDRVSRERLAQCLSHLVLPSYMSDLLGPAVNSSKSMLLYGDPGNGKTSIAEAVGEAFSDEIYVPYCFEVGGQIVNLFDPTIHTPVEPIETTSLAKPKNDARWQRCKRPFVLTGGELNLDMLDLAFNPISRYYEAPVHVKAIGGVFVVDDFGRQRTDPQAVLNRWIIPLERRYDFLTLHTGKKFSIPFDQLAIFSTNIPPEKLADAGGLRRLYYKIHVPTPTDEDYRQIFEDVAEKAELPFDEKVFVEFYDKHYANGKAIPAGHHPRYIVDFVLSICNFRGEPPNMNMPMMDAGWNNLSTDQS